MSSASLCTKCQAKPARRDGLCGPCGGRDRCSMPGCDRQSRGKEKLCQKHNPRRVTCSTPGCNLTPQVRGGSCRRCAGLPYPSRHRKPKKAEKRSLSFPLPTGTTDNSSAIEEPPFKIARVVSGLVKSHTAGNGFSIGKVNAIAPPATIEPAPAALAEDLPEDAPVTYSTEELAELVDLGLLDDQLKLDASRQVSDKENVDMVAKMYGMQEDKFDMSNLDFLDSWEDPSFVADLDAIGL